MCESHVIHETRPMADPFETTSVEDGPTRFGAFIAPFHPLDGNPTMQLRRDLELAVVLDELGFDEVWFGEHHSAGFETIGSPELMIAAAGERTKRIQLGTGVNSVSYHNPLVLADRIVQLDHLTRGRVIMGIGPGQLPTDASMLGIDPTQQRRMMAESLEVLLPLLRGETVTASTDWFNLQDARVQLLPYSRNGIEVGIASVYSPTGVTLAGRHGLSVLSVAASDPRISSGLADNWAIHEKAAAEHGTQPRRDRWRVVNHVHLANSRAQALKDLEYGILRSTEYFEGLTGQVMNWRTSPQTAVETFLGEGLPSWGTIVAGDPQTAIESISALTRSTGGFGTYLLSITECAPFDAVIKSLELFAEFVMPHFQQSNRNRVASLEWAHSNSERLIGSMSKAITQATAQYSTQQTIPSKGRS